MVCNNILGVSPQTEKREEKGGGEGGGVSERKPDPKESPSPDPPVRVLWVKGIGAEGKHLLPHLICTLLASPRCLKVLHQI